MSCRLLFKLSDSARADEALALRPQKATGEVGNLANGEAPAKRVQQVEIREQLLSGRGSVIHHPTKLDALLEEFEAFRETSMVMAEAKDAEVERLLEANSRLRDELREARKRDAAADFQVADRGVSSTGTGAHCLLSLGAFRIIRVFGVFRVRD